MTGNSQNGLLLEPKERIDDSLIDPKLNNFNSLFLPSFFLQSYFTLIYCQKKEFQLTEEIA